MNFDELKEFLSTDITPSELSKKLDELIFDFIIVYGNDEADYIVSPQTVSNHCYLLRALRDLFSKMQ